MQALDLYANIEPYLGFDEEIHYLYKTIGHIAVSKEPKTLIDIGCGQGEFCNIMNLNGIKTLGVDLSAKQIELALEKGIDAQCIDIKDIKEKYDCATAVFDVINYIPKKALKEFLQHSYNLLNDGGHFIFDINSLFGFEEIAQGTLTIDNDTNFIAIDANYENDTLTTDITLFLEENKLFKKHQGTIRQYYHSNDHLKKVLESIGFEVEDIVELFLHDEEQNDKFIFICKKA